MRNGGGRGGRATLGGATFVNRVRIDLEAEVLRGEEPCASTASTGWVAEGVHGMLSVWATAGSVRAARGRRV